MIVRLSTDLAHGAEQVGDDALGAGGQQVAELGRVRVWAQQLANTVLTSPYTHTVGTMVLARSPVLGALGALVMNDSCE